MIEENMPLARSLARRFRPTSDSAADIEQVAYLGLIKAVDRYDPQRGTAFSSLAVPYILGSIKRHFRDCGWLVHVARDTRELGRRIERVSEEMYASTGRHPSAAELAEAMDTSLEAVLAAREAHQALYCQPLDTPKGGDDADNQALHDSVGDEDARLEQALDRCAIEPALRNLGARERLALKLYFGADMTQTAVGRELGCSQMHVSRIIRQALDRLQADEVSDGLRDPS
jgi:RNA polymerase sigma-B factor